MSIRLAALLDFSVARVAGFDWLVYVCHSVIFLLALADILLSYAQGCLGPGLVCLLSAVCCPAPVSGPACVRLACPAVCGTSSWSNLLAAIVDTRLSQVLFCCMISLRAPA